MVNEEISLKEIKKLIPHREPMLLIDKVEIVEPFIRAIGKKRINKNESFFRGHFPNEPIMPGIFIIEALAQTASVLAMHSLKMEAKNKLVYFMSLENAKFRKPVRPNCTLELKVKRKQHRGLVWKFYGEAIVNNKKVADATYSAMIIMK